MTILITGGCGFIGTNLIKYLAERGFDRITILDNFATGSRSELEKLLTEFGLSFVSQRKIRTLYSTPPKRNNPSGAELKIELIEGDIRSQDVCLEAMKNQSAVVHLAAHAGVIPSVEDPFYDFENNALGTLNLLHAAVQLEVEKFIMASSNAPIGDQPSPMREDKALKPLSPYGASKMACEGYCSAFYGSYGLKTLVFRFSNVYGPRCLHKNSVAAKFLKDAMLKKRISIYGDGRQTRDFIHSDDIAQGIFRGLTAPAETEKNKSNIWGEIFHLGTGIETSINDLADLICGLFEDKIQVDYLPARKGEIINNYSDISKARERLDFHPVVSIEEGTREVHQWFMQQGIEAVKKAKVLSGSE